MQLDLNETQSLYEILEVRPDAGPQEIRAAYLRTKASYQRDSLALYSIMGEEEAAQMLRQIEEAFQVLSNPDRKRLYDQSHFRNPPPGPALQGSGAQGPSAKIFSIDRAPPMSGSVEGSEDLLIPPSTDFAGTTASEKSVPPRPPRVPPHEMSPSKGAPAPVAPISTGAELRELRERKGISIDYLV
ncbi:MAG: J domain-containing protein, partial [Oligoflexia bacterium]